MHKDTLKEGGMQKGARERRGEGRRRHPGQAGFPQDFPDLLLRTCALQCCCYLSCCVNGHYWYVCMPEVRISSTEQNSAITLHLSSKAGCPLGICYLSKPSLRPKKWVLR